MAKHFNTYVDSCRFFQLVATFSNGLKKVFLNGNLHEKVHMHPLLGLPHNKGQVCHFRRALYSLKQASHA